MRKFLALLLVFSMITVPVYAGANSLSEELVLKVKNLCGITDDSYEFEISSKKNEEGDTSYTLTWEKSDVYDYRSATITEDGNVIYLFNDGENEHIRIFSPEETRAKAEEFLKEAIPKYYDSLVYKECRFSTTSYFEHIFTIYNNGIETDCDVSVEVDKYSNTILRYYFPEYYLTLEDNMSFPNQNETDKAKTKLEDDFVTGYMINYDNDLKKNVARVVHKLRHYAVTTDFEYYNSTLFNTDGISMDASAAEAGLYKESFDTELIPEEMASIDRYNNLITIDDAIGAVKSKLGIELDKDNFKIGYSIDDKDTNKYKVYLENKTGADTLVELDEQCNILSFFESSADKENESTKALSKEELRSKAKAYMEAVSQGLELDDDIKTLNYDYTSANKYSVNFMRNGIVSFNESIYVTLDDDGKLTDLRVQLYQDDIFSEKPDIAVSKAVALDTAYSKYDFRPFYTLDYNYDEDINDIYKVVPVFAFEYNFVIDAKTGALLNSLGKDFKEDKQYIDYKDLNNQWYANMARELVYMGRRFKDDEFKGDEYLTFGAWDDFSNHSWYYDTEPYKDWKEDKLITRQEFAKMLMPIIQCPEAVYTLNNAFVKPFDDVDSQYIGAVAILKGLNAIDDAEKFRGNDYITRAEAISMYYKVTKNIV